MRRLRCSEEKWCQIEKGGDNVGGDMRGGGVGD